MAAQEPTAHLDRRVVVLLAIACGATVANLYYAQPLLDLLSRELHVGAGVAGLLVTCSQIGYATGLVLLVPLGDLVERRPLVLRMLVGAAAALAVAAAAPSFAVLGVAIALAAIASTVAQILIPMASSLAAEDERGRVVGIIMSGLLLGILLARTVSGLLAALGGWRLVYAVAAALMLLLAVVLARALPESRGSSALSYPRLLRSIPELVAQEPALRRRMAHGALGMGCFSVLWTSVAFLLSRDPYNYSEAAIGLFALAGVAGAAAAQSAGRLADRGLSHLGRGACWLGILLSWGLLELGGTSLVALLAGLVVVDFGIQGQHILNQSSIYALRPDARSRVTTAYMCGNFLTGAVASAASAALWSVAGWGAVCALGAGLAVLGVALWGWEQLRVGDAAAPSAAAMPEASRRA